MKSRRQFIHSGIIGTGLILANAFSSPIEADAAKKKNDEVSANEDLMREHGVLRRALLVYSLTAPKLRRAPESVPPDALRKTALLFRQFGEDYHELRLEEPFIFPAVKQSNPELVRTINILLIQHQLGREITDYILSQSSGAKFSAGGELPNVLDTFVLMYQEHTAREDTIIFPAWHESLREKKYEEMGDKFEEIEKQQFGHDGFEDAVRQIGEIEGYLGLADLGQFNAPAPPMSST